MLRPDATGTLARCRRGRATGVWRARLALALALAPLALGGCPPGNSTSSGTITLYSVPALDGLVTSDGDADSAGTSATIGDGAEASPDQPAQVRRAVVSFDVTPVPIDALIVSATLKVYQDAEATGSSYGDAALGDVLVDHVSYATFGAGAFDAPPLEAGLGTLTTAYTAGSWHAVDVTSALLEDLAVTLSGRSQFRIYHRYGTNHDGVADTDGWSMGDDPTNPPELVIEYE